MRPSFTLGMIARQGSSRKCLRLLPSVKGESKRTYFRSVSPHHAKFFQRAGPRQRNTCTFPLLHLPMERAIMGFSGWGTIFMVSTMRRMGLTTRLDTTEDSTAQPLRPEAVLAATIFSHLSWGFPAKLDVLKLGKDLPDASMCEMKKRKRRTQQKAETKPSLSASSQAVSLMGACHFMCVSVSLRNPLPYIHDTHAHTRMCGSRTFFPRTRAPHHIQLDR